MTPAERRWCLLYAGVVAALTSIPFVLGYLAQGEAWRFTGFVIGVEDGNSYVAKMVLGSQGAWLFRTPYTSFPQRGVVAFVPYLLLGKLAGGAALHEQLVALFHLFRVAAIPLVVMSTYRFVSLFLRESLWRRWATVLSTVGGGLGWVLVALGETDWQGSLPLDFHSPEAFGFLSLFTLPHLALARAIQLFALAQYLGGGEVRRIARAGGGALALLALVQPLTVLTTFAVLGAHGLLLLGAASAAGNLEPVRRWGKRALPMFLLPLPLLVYYAYAFSTDPFLKAWTAQNVILSPPPAHYLVAYGPWLILGLLGGQSLVREGEPRGLLLVAWVIALPALAYAPHNLQRRLPDGVWVAIVTLAAVGLSRGLALSFRRRAAAVVLMALALPSSAMLLMGSVASVRRPAEPIFRGSEEVAAFQWLKDNVLPGSVVLSSFSTGNALPAWAPLRVVIGHGPESVHLDALRPQVEGAYSPDTTPSERRSFLEQHGVDLVFYGPRERSLGGWDPGTDPALTLVYEAGDIRVFGVRGR